MDALIRIKPARRTVVVGTRTIRAEQIHLGGALRGAALVLCDAGDLGPDSEAVANDLLMQGYEPLVAEIDGDTTERDHRADIGALLDVLAERGWEHQQVGVLGYGTGARVALTAAFGFDLGAVVSISSAAADVAAHALHLLDRPAVMRVPWLGLFTGTATQAAGALADLRRRLRADAPVYTRVVGYADGSAWPHLDDRDAVDHAASFDSWQRAMEWLNLRVVPRPTELAMAWARRQANE
ncbi:hypothetical protein [Streptosporangium sp. NPDC049046]|uniref:hypothetical protein n=1 Tax=Streptosporangium sp. NPDC049046 TaxID=3155031 RepID=UPI00341E31E9